MADAASRLTRYYRWHSRVYDATRWAFLFGRGDFAWDTQEPGSILEIGCGTGRNLVALARRFPQARVTGIDLSPEMLAVARPKTAVFGGRVSLISGAYTAPLGGERPFDLILLSYCLSMINPGFEEAIRLCKADLSTTGRLVVVDFHDSPAAWFRRWMAVNHVRIDGHLLPSIEALGLRVTDCRIRRAYGGLWRWFSCVAVRQEALLPS